MTSAQQAIAIIYALILIAASGAGGFYAGHWQGQTEAYQAVLGSMHEAVARTAGKAP
jgi:hypothetical protein